MKVEVNYDTRSAILKSSRSTDLKEVMDSFFQNNQGIIIQDLQYVVKEDYLIAMLVYTLK